MKRDSSVAKFLRPLHRAPAQAYFSDELQVPDLLEWILQQVGTSEIWQTTFSISEEYLRRLHSIRESGLVSRLNLLLDFKATNKTVNLWLFISQVVDSAVLANNHSKILLVSAACGRKVAVVTSQNLTRGNRNESAFIIESAEVHDRLLSQIQDVINTKSIPLNDILSGID